MIKDFKVYAEVYKGKNKGKILPFYYCAVVDNDTVYIDTEYRGIQLIKNPITVCQNINIKDKNDNWVYEYDIVEIKLKDGSLWECYVVYDLNTLQFVFKDENKVIATIDDVVELYILGNINEVK